MKANEKFVGKEFKHRKYRTIYIEGIVPGSWTKVIATVSDRGKGWNEFSQSYRGIRFKGGWSRGQNYMYGEKVEVHIKEIGDEFKG